MPATGPSSRKGSRRGSVAGPPASTTNSSSRRVSVALPSPTNSSAQSAGLQSLDARMQGASLQDSIPLHPRSAPGTKGQKLTVATNHFKINLSQFPEAIHKYNVVIRKGGQNFDSAIGRVNRRVLQLLLQMPVYAKGVYTDYQKTVFSFSKLTARDDTSSFAIVDYYEPEEQGPRTGAQQITYRVMITTAGPPLPTKPLTDLMNNSGVVIHRADEYEEALNVILLKHAGQHSQLTTSARGAKVFPLTGGNTRADLSSGIWAYRGYARRIRLLQSGPMLCVNTTASAMYEEGYGDSLVAKWKPPHPPKTQEQRIDMLDQFLKRLRVQGRFGANRVKPIMRIVRDKNHQLMNADQVTFKCEQHPLTGAPLNKEVSVSWYFSAAYPDIKPRTSKPPVFEFAGMKGRPLYWRSDHVWVMPGQSYKRLLPFAEQAQAMIKFACRQPKDNVNFIHGEGLKMLGINQNAPNLTVGTASGTPLQVWMEMSAIPARRLPAPTLQFATSKLSPADTAKGQWNLAGKRFYQRGKQTAYTVITLKRPNQREITNSGAFRSMVAQEIAKYLGLNTKDTQATRPITVDWPGTNQLQTLKDKLALYKRNGVDYAFIILSDPKWYNTLKIAADSVGVQTTVTLRKKDDSVKASVGEVSNLLLKFNLKIGGVNWAISLDDHKAILKGRTTAFIGADVVHPPPGSRLGAPSVASVVMSLKNTLPAQFTGTTTVQFNENEAKQAEEMIKSLHSAMVTLLHRWQKSNNGTLPQQLFYCRDGVSDQQLHQILSTELPLIKEACRRMYGPTKQALPDILILVTQKRHIVRLYQPKGDRSSAFDPRGNPMPGIIVDTDIVKKDVDDWYIVSHKTLQGTAVPAHHIRIYDEIKCNVDDLQALTYALAFTFGRSVTSISETAPARFAHLLCERAKVHLHDVYVPPPGDDGPYDSTRHFAGDSNIHPDIRETMYFV